MWIIPGPGCLHLCKRPLVLRGLVFRSYATKTSDPLRILFCGSDEFSIAHLKALHAYQLKQPERISSIDVVCRPGKRVGRGLKQIREVPLKAAASALSLPIHEIDTFTGWTPPTSPDGHINLVIAVSFGLFVPPRILNGAKYGGLNVHPSLLPNFRGAAPLHHTLIAGETTTGVTVQTLHPKHFDHGVILSQTPAPGFDIPNPDFCTVPELVDFVAPKGAQMLVESIEKGLFVPPIADALAEKSGDLKHAPKITPEDRHINWANWTLADINRRNRVIGPLWSKALCASNPADGPLSFQQKRVILTNIEEVDPPKGSDSFSILPGLPFTNAPHPVEPRKSRQLYVFTADGKVLRINRMKVEGEQDAEGLRAAIKARMFGDRAFQYEGRELTPFRNSLV
ncbi:hypothetical protein CBS147317_5511 [Penicillium roqueforti]|nr:hypothetical protein CBS147355_4891 [Penicillium roqueforti]KAI2686759.1 hypothetical protein LCP963914a_4359 [Penicillium roqueforti]KAI2704254.1 hypothetical protein CBS147372_2723 [Penicillium roqueforti]KAI3130071.1 hypothetical protein CBS147330_4836 [Penicillium roqueforti]KAI3155640.1 hypothetical protein CBS147317_5511 [Penicillium roqueforti]